MNLDTKIPPPIVTLLIEYESKDYELNTDWISIKRIISFLLISAVIQFIREKQRNHKNN